MNVPSTPRSSLNNTQFLACLFLALLGGFLFLALSSYTPIDPSWSYLSSDTQQVSNLGGAVGAWVGNLLRAFLGLPSLLIPFFLWSEIYYIYQHRQGRFKRWSAQICLIITIAILLASVHEISHTTAPMTQGGGIFGYEVAQSIASLITIYGAFLVGLILFILICSMAFATPWYDMYQNLKKLPAWFQDVFYRNLPQKTTPAPETQDIFAQTQPYSTAQTAVNNEATPEIEPTVTTNTTDEQEHFDINEEELKNTHFKGVNTVNINADHVYFGDVWQNSDKSEEHLQEIQKLLEQSQQKLSSLQALEKENTTQTMPNPPTVEKVTPVSPSAFDELHSDFILREHATQQNIANIDRRINELNQQLAKLKAQDLNTPINTEQTISEEVALVTVQETDITPQKTVFFDLNSVKPLAEKTTEPAPKDAPIEESAIEEKPQNAMDKLKSLLHDKKTYENANPSLNLVRERLTQPDPLSELQTMLAQSKTVVSPKYPSDIEPTHHEALYDDYSGIDDELPIIKPKAELNTHTTLQNRSIAQNLSSMQPINDDFHDHIHDNLHDDINDDINHIHDTVYDNHQTYRTATPQNIASSKPISTSTPLQDFDDDAPLIDASGRMISRAMQVVEQRKLLSPLPSIDLLDPVDPSKKVQFSDDELDHLAKLLELKLQDFNIKASVEEIDPGPVVTRFALSLAPGVKATKVASISQDLARSMSQSSVRIVLSIPGTPFIGVEIPNKKREMVRLIELVKSEEFLDPNVTLSMAMGKNITGKPVLTNLSKAPHMLVAGTTGSGKSVAVNAMLLSLLLKYTPAQLRLVLIDPKMLELANYDEIPHLLSPVITDMKKATNALNWCVNEMERRYALMAMFKLRQISQFNQRIIQAQANGEDLIDPTWKPENSATQQRAPRLQPLPSIVVVADEFADMMMQQSGKKTEELITRLAQKARAAGIHLLLATQRPSVDVITGLIKANIPTRVALRVNSKIDSRTILDAGGAEELLGNGDMLFLGPGQNEPERVHGAFISDDEVNRICDAWRERGSPNYVDDILVGDDDEDDNSRGGSSDFGDAPPDALYDDAVEYVLQTRKTSISALQRQFGIGYQRAAKLIDTMERNGIISAPNSSNKRDILV